MSSVWYGPEYYKYDSWSFESNKSNQIRSHTHLFKFSTVLWPRGDPDNIMSDVIRVLDRTLLSSLGELLVVLFEVEEDLAVGAEPTDNGAIEDVGYILVVL